MQYSKQIKRIINMIVLVVVLSTLLHITGLALEPISYSTYFNHDTEIIDGKNESYDLIFVGASRVIDHLFQRYLKKRVCIRMCLMQDHHLNR